MDFEKKYQDQFSPVAGKHPIGTEVFANGKVYKVIDFFGINNRFGVVGVDREGNEKEIYETDCQQIQYKVCGRCGGSGRYSYNLKDGSICYGCGGAGKNILAPSGFPQKIKMVCVADLTKFGYVKGDEMTGEFCGFSKTGGTPKYLTFNPRRRRDNILIHSTITKHFDLKGND